MANLVIANANAAVIQVVNNYLNNSKKKRTNKRKEEMISRLNWENHADTLVRNKMFDRMYRMPLEEFNKVTQYVREGIEKRKNKDSKQYYPLYIIPEIRLHCMIRFLLVGRTLTPAHQQVSVNLDIIE